MRDLVILFFVFGALPFVLARPHLGVLLWAWLGFMNPHRFGWGLAANLPLSAITAGVTVVGALFSREPKRIPWSGMLFVWLALILWFNVATLFALNPENSWPDWGRTMKIQFAILLALMLINNPERLKQLVWVTGLSLAFFGVKGGLFAIATGGNYLVMGPPKSFIADNNSLALALIMTLPLLRFLHLQEKRTWLRHALLGAMALTALAILTSHSRGALIAGSVMALVLWMKSPGKLKTGLVILILVPAVLAFMPEKWFERMSTIRTYQQDASAMGRINAWGFAINVANDRPLTGAGFNAFTQENFDQYAPNPRDLHDAHSIYFEVLAEQGYVGLVLFLALGWLAFRTGSRILSRARDRPELNWARDLASMIQVSLIGYAVGGAFLGLAYFDLYYQLIAILAIARGLVEQELAVASAPLPRDVGREPGGSVPHAARSR